MVLTFVLFKWSKNRLSTLCLQIFHDVAYKAKDRADLLSGIDEFLDQVTVLPPGEWDPTIRIEPPKSIPSQVRLGLGLRHSDTRTHTHTQLLMGFLNWSCRRKGRCLHCPMAPPTTLTSSRRRSIRVGLSYRGLAGMYVHTHSTHTEFGCFLDKKPLQ